MSCSLVYRENILSREHIPYVENTFYTGRQHTWAAAKTAARSRCLRNMRRLKPSKTNFVHLSQTLKI